MIKIAIFILVILIIVVIVSIILYNKKTPTILTTTTTNKIVDLKVDTNPSWKFLGNAACRDKSGNYTSLMFNQHPPYYIDTLSNCQAACVSNAACQYVSNVACETSSNSFCMGVSFFSQGLPGFGKCYLLSDTPYLSDVNKDSEKCFSY